MQQIHEDKNKPTGKRNSSNINKNYLATLFWRKWSKKKKKKSKQRCSSDCQRLQEMTEPNKNQPKQIKCKTWLNKGFSQFQQVSARGPDCSRSRGELSDGRAGPLSLLGIRSHISPPPNPPGGMLWCRGARGSSGEDARRCVTPGLALGASFQHHLDEGFAIMCSRGYKVTPLFPLHQRLHMCDPDWGCAVTVCPASSQPRPQGSCLI